MIIWLASYPKSGNTWLRSFLSFYCYGRNDKFDFKLLNKIKKFPDINDLKNLNIDYFNTKELIKNWLHIQNYINLKGDFNFLKTHNALCTIDDNPFTSSQTSIGAIYLVRDPRDVIISLSHHFNTSYDQTFKIMASDNYWETETKFGNFHSSIFGSWANNYKSWKNTKIFETLIIRYEDLISDPFLNFSKIIRYLENKINIKYDETLIKKTIEFTSFKNLQEMEKNGNFDESTYGMFFRKGEAKQWQTSLDKNVAEKIKVQFGDIMEENGYLN